MAYLSSSCPTKKNAVNKIRETLAEMALKNPSITDEIQDLNESLAEGMVLRGGKKRRVRGASVRKHIGGMPPRLDDDKNHTEFLNAVAHIIAAGALVGGGSALTCYIAPAIEAYLLTLGWLPKLCSGTGLLGAFEWGVRTTIGIMQIGESCMAVQERYSLIIMRLIAMFSIPTASGIWVERARIGSGYMGYQKAIYNVLRRSVDKILHATSSGKKETPISGNEIKKVVDKIISKEFKLNAAETTVLAEITPEQAAHLAQYEKEVVQLEKEGAEAVAQRTQASEAAEEEEGSSEEELDVEEQGRIGMPHSWGGKRRMTKKYKKGKTDRKNKKNKTTRKNKKNKTVRKSKKNKRSRKNSK